MLMLAYYLLVCTANPLSNVYSSKRVLISKIQFKRWKFNKKKYELAHKAFCQ